RSACTLFLTKMLQLIPSVNNLFLNNVDIANFDFIGRIRKLDVLNMSNCIIKCKIETLIERLNTSKIMKLQLYCNLYQDFGHTQNNTLSYFSPDYEKYLQSIHWNDAQKIKLPTDFVIE